MMLVLALVSGVLSVETYKPDNYLYDAPTKGKDSVYQAPDKYGQATRYNYPEYEADYKKKDFYFPDVNGVLKKYDDRSYKDYSKGNDYYKDDYYKNDYGGDYSNSWGGALEKHLPDLDLGKHLPDLKKGGDYYYRATYGNSYGKGDLLDKHLPDLKKGDDYYYNDYTNSYGKADLLDKHLPDLKKGDDYYYNSYPTNTYGKGEPSKYAPDVGYGKDLLPDFKGDDYYYDSGYGYKDSGYGYGGGDLLDKVLPSKGGLKGDLGSWGGLKDDFGYSDPYEAFEDLRYKASSYQDYMQKAYDVVNKFSGAEAYLKAGPRP